MCLEARAPCVYIYVYRYIYLYLYMYIYIDHFLLTCFPSYSFSFLPAFTVINLVESLSLCRFPILPSTTSLSLHTYVHAQSHSFYEKHK